MPAFLEKKLKEEELELFSWLSPFIENAGYTWTINQEHELTIEKDA